MKTLYKNCKFIKSSASLSDCPRGTKEVAFVGRSNSGKSSAINCLTKNKIAKTSKTPGRTQLINFFSIADGYYLVDLPGYGYAKVSLDKQKIWRKFIDEYLFLRQELVGVIIVMDCRHPLQKFDCIMLDFCADNNLLAHILLTKMDKLSKNKQIQTLHAVNKNLSNKWQFATSQLFSASKKTGTKQLEKVINKWLFTNNN